MSFLQGLNPVGTADIRSYFEAQINTAPFELPPNHSHNLFPSSTDEDVNPPPLASDINFDTATTVAPPLHQQTLLTNNDNGTYSVPWGTNIHDDCNWDDTLRWVYANPNGIPAHESEFALTNQLLFERRCSISSIAETKLDTDQFWIQDMIS